MHYHTKHSLFLARHILTLLSRPVNLTLLLEIMHCVHNLQIIHQSVGCAVSQNSRLSANEKTDDEYNV